MGLKFLTKDPLNSSFQSFEIFLNSDEGLNLGHILPNFFHRIVGSSIFYIFWCKKTAKKLAHDAQAFLFWAQASLSLCVFDGEAVQACHPPQSYCAG
jgi:hypothetical protein